MRLAFLLTGLIMATLLGCSPAGTESVSEASATAETGSPETAVTASDVFIVKPAPGRDIASGGLNLTVTEEPLWLVGASAGFADTVELHTMSMEDGMMRMRQVEKLEVSEEAPLVLERGGNHLMFFGVSPDLEIGDSAEVLLTLTDSSGDLQTLAVQAEIISLTD